MTDTVPALKRAFLNAQVRNLSAPLSPPQNWRDGVPVPQEGDLRDKVVEDVLSKGK